MLSGREPDSLYCLAPAKVQFTEHPGGKESEDHQADGGSHSNLMLEPGE